MEAVKSAKDAGSARVIAVNNTWERAPWADALYACDAPWWRHYRPNFKGQRWSQSHDASTLGTGVRHVLGLPRDDLSFDPAHIHNGRNGGFQALNLAILFGAAKIILLGFDMQATDGKTHWHGDHEVRRGGERLTNPDANRFQEWLRAFERAARQLKDRGEPRVINATTETALTCFEQMELGEALHA